MHEAWVQVILPDKTKRVAWRYELSYVARRDEKKLGWKSASNLPCYQRAEAFLRTLNLWTE